MLLQLPRIFSFSPLSTQFHPSFMVQTNSIPSFKRPSYSAFSLPQLPFGVRFNAILPIFLDSRILSSLPHTHSGKVARNYRQAFAYLCFQQLQAEGT